jgi:hypothetical protein
MGIIKEIFCNHKTYKIIDCKKETKDYKCQCLKCGYQFSLPKAKGEMYEVGSIIKLY